ncbi:unnamed protein product [Phyllotreta striolata]|uniref:Cap-specific mRNA (nucleoside-2'-O-)-methyltransferase 1 n=1 Tax=Phyllotreta striolata TaxID=444603 RepID=A0A9N9TKU5_PHYSR|nr:unnamed protein product [Phyllotreta striolata]
MFSESSIDYDYELTMSQEYLNLNLNDNGPEKVSRSEASGSHVDERALRMMQKMGYKEGYGLGKNEQGITKLVDFSYQLGKKGFGLKLKKIEDNMETWDFNKDEVFVKENLSWLSSDRPLNSSFEEMCSWIEEGSPITDINTQSNFCDEKILTEVIKAKDIFDEMDALELCQARARCNPFETVRSVFFMNRAALKMANIDAITDFEFTNIDKNEYFKDDKGPFYFADVCAGPGGFTEYILWRKKWLFKGFGMTLKDDNDFKLYESYCACPATFQAFYGKDGDGNVCSPNNILDFKEKVLCETGGKGVHFMMSDGGFSVEGNENFQEILSKSIYLCQCLVALEIVRSHGHFVTKLFDVFTSFSVGLLFLIYHCFEKVSIIKPNSSRPANSERYFVCTNLKRNTPYFENLKKYLWTIVNQLWERNDPSIVDILEIVPLEVIKKDDKFFKYIFASNNCVATYQTFSLRKLATFCRNPTLVECRQSQLRKECLEFWKIPDKKRIPIPHLNPSELVNTIFDKLDIMLAPPREIVQIKTFNELIVCLEDWYYFPLFSSLNKNNCNFYASTSYSKVYRLQNQKWVKIKNIQLSKHTLCYGEFVKETCITKSETNNEIENVRYSLHIIDAIQLGDCNLTNMNFSKRQEMIDTYCKSLNKENQRNLARIRPKMVDKLVNISSECLISREENGLFSKLPLLGYNSISETFIVNSILLFKNNLNQPFSWSYVLRVQIFLKDKVNEEGVSLEDILNEVKRRL